MPKLSVWLVRASLLHMGTGFLFGALLLANKGLPLSPWLWQLLTPHVEIMTFGWTMQFVMGIAFWILPRYSTEPRYGRAAQGWWSFGLLNGGLLLTVAGAWFALDGLSIIGNFCTFGAVLLFIGLMYPRIRPSALQRLPPHRDKDMEPTYTLVEDLTNLTGPIQPDSIISRTFFRGDHLKAIVFAFDTGQELSEHTASQSAIIQIMQGEAAVTAGDDRHELKAGSWLYLPPRLKHSVVAHTPLVMQLLMFGAE
jgi:quercetin dioxygenase-like cupin family protein